jgi:hypothetical protein
MENNWSTCEIVHCNDFIFQAYAELQFLLGIMSRLMARGMPFSAIFTVECTGATPT